MKKIKQTYKKEQEFYAIIGGGIKKVYFIETEEVAGQLYMFKHIRDKFYYKTGGLKKEVFLPATELFTDFASAKTRVMVEELNKEIENKKQLKNPYFTTIDFAISGQDSSCYVKKTAERYFSDDVDTETDVKSFRLY